jgi:hypothetical protein
MLPVIHPHLEQPIAGRHVPGVGQIVANLRRRIEDPALRHEEPIHIEQRCSVGRDVRFHVGAEQRDRADMALSGHEALRAQRGSRIPE